MKEVINLRTLPGKIPISITRIEAIITAIKPVLLLVNANSEDDSLKYMSTTILK
jgi:hypothetical protein